MDPVKLLDHYKVSLFDNAAAIQVLAHLIRRGPLTETDLATALELTSQQVNREATSLFRAGLLNRLPDAAWTASEVAQQILESQQILDPVRADLIASLVPTIQDQKLLQDWAEHQLPGQGSDTFLSLARSLDQTIHYQGNTHLEFPDPARLAYAIAVAADPTFHAHDLQAGVEAAVTYFSQQVELKNSLWHDHHVSPGTLDIVTTDKIKQGYLLYLSSNECLTQMASASARPDEEDGTLLAWVRALDASLTGKPDYGLRDKCISWQTEDAVTFWGNVFKSDQLHERSRALYDIWTGKSDDSDDTVLVKLGERLISAITNAQDITPPLQFAGYQRTAGVLTGNSPNAERVIATLNQALATINELKFDSMNEQDVASVADAARALILSLGNLVGGIGQYGRTTKGSP